MDGSLIQRGPIYQFGREEKNTQSESSITGIKEIMKQPSQTHPIDSRHPEDQKTKKSLMQAIEEVLRKNGLEPKWDYSKAGQSAIMPSRKEHDGSPGTRDSQSSENGK